ncbi:MAG: hypothetical protein JJE25_02980 [Bacteroidia bacterium]|nr:hypothetical protein [Bacteroidia bacterium]
METICNSKFIIQNSLFIILFIPFFSFSQDTLIPPPKLPPAHITFTKEDDVDKFNTGKVEAIDSTLACFYHFDKFLYNITFDKNIFNDEEKIRDENQIVKFSDDKTSPYKFSDHTIRYYKLNRRFTEITYLSGRKKEQLLNITYAQNIAKGWNAGLDFRRSGAQGFFRRQLYYQSSFDVFTYYEAPKGRYSLSAYYIRNRLEQQENGGIRDFNPNENTVAEPVYLSSAENKQTDKEILLRQSFQLNRLAADSLPSTNQTKLIVAHAIRYETRGNAYNDAPVDSFYQNNFFSSSVSTDSTWYQRWNNELFFSSLSNDSIGFTKYSFTAGHEYFIYKYGSPSQIFLPGQKENIYSRGELSIGTEKKWMILSKAYYVLAGDNEKDYNVSAEVFKTILQDRWKLFFNGFTRLRQPDIEENRKYSNHFIWFNDYSPVNSGKAEAGITSIDKSILLSGSINTVKTFIFYNWFSAPVQLSGSVNSYSATLGKNFLWRNWHLENKIIWQKAGNEGVIHLPELMTGHSLYYEKLFFKKVLLARIGTDVRYISSYYADRYMPALQRFYLQDLEKTGGYALADFFINFRIKASLFFIKAENIFSGVSQNTLFVRPDYPVTPRVIRFGLQLRFYD